MSETSDCGADGGAAKGRAKKGSSRAVTKAKLHQFFAELSESCSVKAAAAAADVARSTLYKRRYADPEFAARWVEAVSAGYDQVEARLLRFVLSGGEEDPDADGGQVVAVAGQADEATSATIEAEGNESAMAVRFQPKLGRVPQGMPPWVQTGLVLLHRYRTTVSGTKPGFKGRAIATAEETDAFLAKRLDMLARAHQRKGAA